MQPTPPTMATETVSGCSGSAGQALHWPKCAELPTAEIVARLADSPDVLAAIGADLETQATPHTRWTKGYAVLRAVLSHGNRHTPLALKIEAAKIALDLAGHRVDAEAGESAAPAPASG